MAVSNAELLTSRPDLLMLALKLVLLTHTGRPTDSAQLSLGITPGEAQSLAERELEIDPQDGKLVLSLKGAETQLVSVRRVKQGEQWAWEVKPHGVDKPTYLAGVISPPEVQVWVMANIGVDTEVRFERGENV